jgi:tetratricopeptide (TPR) repeat protein
VDTFTEYLAIDPDNVQALCAIAECYENMNDPELALDYYTRAIKADPECPDAYYGKSLILMERHDYDLAIGFASCALRLDPENAEYYYGLGAILLRIDDNELAAQAFWRAVRLDPFDTESWLILSELAGQVDLYRALSILELACMHNPDESTIHFRKAALFFILKNKKACLASLEQALSIDPLSNDDFLAICPEAIMYEEIKTIYLQYKKQA